MNNRIHYTDERNIQILISLLKEHNIKKIIASPGTTNLTFIGSVQNDPYFEIYSSVDERSAAYMACGIAEESGECVVLSCTGATASRNYLPGLTEAYYKKLPILAVTATQYIGNIEQHIAQVIDRSSSPRDTVIMSKQINEIHTAQDTWHTVIAINEAILELTHKGGGPVHLNIETTYSRNFNKKELPKIRKIQRIAYNDNFPALPNSRIAIFVGAHTVWTKKLTDIVEKFCKKFDAVVLCDQVSNYKGSHAVYPAIVCSQEQYISPCRNLKLLIHIGSISGADIRMNLNSNYEVWRVNPDGKIRDTFKKLKYIFEMDEFDFFKKCIDINTEHKNRSYYTEWKNECEKLTKKIPELPYSNVWIAERSINKFPSNCTVYFAILNTLRSWNFFESPNNIIGLSNTGGFGIDGGLSTLVGASLCNPQKLYYCLIGDLSFFYDMNVLGNRHISNNIRIMVINNGRGTEFTNYNHPGAIFGDAAKNYIAAEGHFGNKSKSLLKHYAEDLGFDYYSASSKHEYIQNESIFLNPKILNKPILLEVFTNGSDESDAIKIMHYLKKTALGATKEKIKRILGEDKYKKLKKMLKP